MSDEAEYAFDDEYIKCSKRMEMKFVPQLLKEEMAESDLLKMIWDNAAISWEARKAHIVQPLNFKDAYGVTLMAYVTEAQEKTPFYYTFNTFVKVAGKSREDYVYTFPFKAFHFYLVRALQLLRRPCEESYRKVVYSSISPNVSLAFNSSVLPDISLTLGERNQTRLDSYILAYPTKPPAANNQQVLTIHTCFGVAVGKFFNKEREGAVLIPLNEVFQVTQGGSGLILRSINKTCSYFDCAFLGGKCISHGLAFSRRRGVGYRPRRAMGVCRERCHGFQSQAVSLSTTQLSDRCVY